MTDNKKNNPFENMELNINVSYTDKEHVENGKIERPVVVGIRDYKYKHNYNILNLKIKDENNEDPDAYKCERVTLSEDYFCTVEESNRFNIDKWKAMYAEGVSVEEIYAKIVEDVKQNADNPDYMAYLMGSLAESYYLKKENKINTGNDAIETLTTILNTQEGKCIDGFVCMNIHEFGMRLLNDCGINAVTLLGNMLDGIGHAALLYQRSDGKYVYTDYNASYLLEAKNIKEAAREVYKNSFDLVPISMIGILTDKGSYSEYAFKDESVWGNEIDKSEYNRVTVFDHNIDNNSSINYNGNFTNHLNSSFDAGMNLVFKRENSAHQVSANFGYKQNTNSTMADESKSLGVKLNYDSQFNIKNLIFRCGIKNIIGYNDIRLINDNYVPYEMNPFDYHTETTYINYEKIKGELLEQGYSNDDIENNKKCILAKGSMPSPIGFSSGLLPHCDYNYKNIFNMTRLYTGIEYPLFKSNENDFKGLTEWNCHNTDISSNRLGLEQGFSLETIKNNTVLKNEITLGIIGDTEQSSGEQKGKFQIGGKFNASSGFVTKLADNVAFGAKASAFVSPTQVSTNYGGSASLFAEYKPNSNITLLGNIQAKTSQQQLHLGGFNQHTENTTALGTTLGVNINNKATVTASYQGQFDALNKTRNQSTASIGVKINL